jgi:Uma2 family endonuclease
VSLEGYGSWTLKDEREERAAEPDECYTIGGRPASETDRPDVAIEVIWTSGGIDKLEVYRKLGVREVWFYERGTLRFFALRAGDQYHEIACSELLPQLPVDVLLECLREPDQTSALRALRSKLQGYRTASAVELTAAR